MEDQDNRAVEETKCRGAFMKGIINYLMKLLLIMSLSFRCHMSLLYVLPFYQLKIIQVSQVHVNVFLNYQRKQISLSDPVT